MNFDQERTNVFFPYKIITYPEILNSLVTGQEVAPINIEINLTNQCNHNCIWCTYGYLRNNGDILSGDVVRRVLKEARDLGVQSVTWTGGGEPTVHRGFNQLIRYANELGFKQGLNTNGYLLNEEAISFIARNFSYVRFSVDAASPATLQKCHGARETDFSVITRNIRAVCTERERSNSNCVVGFSFLIDSSNYEDTLPAVRLAKSMGANYIQLKPIVHYDRDNSQFSSTSKLWEYISHAFIQAKELETDHFAVHILDHKFRNIRLEKENYGRQYTKCVGCNLLASIGADGAVDLCCAYKGMKHWAVGNVYSQFLKDIWFGEKRKQLRDSVDIRSCPPMCKADETNRLVHFLQTFDANKEFI